MKTQNLIFQALSIAAVLLLGSCKKNDVSPNSNATYHFEVDFNSSTIDINTVDSVTISFSAAGGPAVIKKMQRTANSYRIDNVDTCNQPLNAQITVYTPKVTDVLGTKPIRVFVYDVTGTKDLAMNGPLNTKTDVWKPRFIFADDNQQVRLTISEDEEDTYFSLQANHPQDWILAHFQKSILGADGRFLDTGVWETFSTDSIFPQGSNTIVDTNNFVPYATRIANMTWAQDDINLLMFQKGNSKPILWHSVYSRRK